MKHIQFVPMQVTTPSATRSRSLLTNDLKKLIHKSLADGLTGQIHVTFQKEKNLTIFAHQGMVRQFYIRNHRAPDTNWEIPLTEYGRGDLEIDEMPPRGMMFNKIVLEKSDRTIPQASGTNQLSTMFNLADLNFFPTLFQIEWGTAEAFVLVAGKDIPIRQVIMKTSDGVMEGQAALDQVTAWKEAGCHISIYRGNIQSQAWLEVHLNILLENYCYRILNQYGKLTGKVMIRSILWNVQTVAVRMGWNLEIQGNAVKDTTIFPTARDAGDAYTKIISEAVAHVEPVIGPSLTQNILVQSLNATRGVYKTIENEFKLLGEVSL